MAGGRPHVEQQLALAKDPVHRLPARGYRGEIARLRVKSLNRSRIAKTSDCLFKAHELLPDCRVSLTEMAEAVHASSGLSEAERSDLLERAMARHHYSGDALIEILHRAQELYGYLSPPVLNRVARSLKLPPSRVFGVATCCDGFAGTRDAGDGNRGWEPLAQRRRRGA